MHCILTTEWNCLANRKQPMTTKITLVNSEIRNKHTYGNLLSCFFYRDLVTLKSISTNTRDSCFSLLFIIAYSLFSSTCTAINAFQLLVSARTTSPFSATSSTTGTFAIAKLKQSDFHFINVQNI